MKLLVVATNPRWEASTRFRALQFFPTLARHGHTAELSAFYPENGSPVTAVRVARGLSRRARDFARAESFDRLFVHREILPYAWNHLGTLLGRSRRLVFDFDDAVQLRSEGKSWKNWLSMPASTRFLVKRADLVYAGNEALADYARQFNPNVVVMPTVVDTDVFRPREGNAPSHDGVPVVGWVGSPTTAQYLPRILPALDRLARTRRFKVRLVGAGRPFRLQNAEVENLDWSIANEVDHFRDLDVGIYPLSDDPWSRGKCGFKAIQYMACGVPCVVDPVGVVKDIVRDETDGLWANDEISWHDQLARLLDDADLRQRLTASGRARAIELYSIDAIYPAWSRGVLGT